MHKTAMIRARMEPGLKAQAEEVLPELGLPPTQAMTIFCLEAVRRQGFPFELRLRRKADFDEPGAHRFQRQAERRGGGESARYVPGGASQLLAASLDYETTLGTVAACECLFEYGAGNGEKGRGRNALGRTQGRDRV